MQTLFTTTFIFSFMAFVHTLVAFLCYPYLTVQHWEASMLNNRYDVSVIPCRYYNKYEVKSALSALVESIDGLSWLTPGMCVAIKANLVTFAKPETATTTHPALICALIELLLERGASRVIVGDSPGVVHYRSLTSI